jgi:hypothetical protein
MEIISYIIGVLLIHKNSQDVFKSIGTIKKRVGNNLLFETNIEGINAIGIVVIDDVVTKINVILTKSINIIDLHNNFGNYNVNYNSYDDFTILSFKLPDNMILIAKTHGFVDQDKLSDKAFSEFEFVKM